jgi:hypothetical protein
MSLGLVMGISTGQSTAFTLGGGFGYFVLPGLEPGVTLDVTFGSDRPTVTSLMPYLRWVFWRSYVLSPFVKAQAGRWFISDAPDLTVLGGGGGVVFFLSQQAGLQLEGLVYRLFPEASCPDRNCWATSVGLSVGMYFGGRRSTPPPPPPPSPPPPSPPPPAPPPVQVPLAPRVSPASPPTSSPTPPRAAPDPTDATRDEPAP